MPTRTRLTDTIIKRLEPHPDGKPVITWDSDIRGFGVITFKTGSKAFVVQRGTRIPRRTIERCDLMKLAEARDTAMDWLRQIGKGIDPRDTRPATSAPTANNTLREIAELYLKRKQLRPSSVGLYRTLLGLDGNQLYLGDWADRPINSISSDMVRQAHNRIKHRAAKSDNQSINKTGNVIADLALRVFGSMWTYASRLDGSEAIADMPARNPVLTLGSGRDGEWFVKGVQRRTRFVDNTDLKPFWSALMSSDTINPISRTLIQVMLLTGLRIGTASRLRWPMIDLTNRRIDIPAELMKGRREHSLPIVDGLYEILVAWRKQGVATSGYLFPSVIAGRHVRDIAFAFRIIAKATGKRYSAHDLRRTFATQAKRAGLNKWIVADLLAHAGRSVTDDYDQTDVEDLRQPLQAVTNRILGLCKSNVVQFNKRRAKAA